MYSSRTSITAAAENRQSSPEVASGVITTTALGCSGESNRTWFPYVIAVAVFVSRAITSGPPYFADGPRHLAAIADHVYAIQPPGYWLFTRLASLFPDPAAGMHYLNWTFSALGVFVFYIVAKRITPLAMAEVATGLYASIYFAWFAGNIHSTYASELFFPVLLVLFILRYRDRHRGIDLAGACAAFALAAGFRPSDGVFLAPVFLFFLAKYVCAWRYRVVGLGLVCLLCLAWLVPNQAALRNATMADHWIRTNTNWKQLESVAPFGKGSAKLAITNVVRVVFPLGLAFWPLLPWLFRRHGSGELRMLLWLWILPGLAFFGIVYIADATYMCYLLAGVVLLACIGNATRAKVVAVVLCMVFNIVFYFAARPVAVTSAPIAIFDVYAAKYTFAGVRSRYYKTLKEVYPPTASGADSSN